MADKNQIEPYKVYNVAEASSLLGVERKTMYKLVEEGKLPSVEIGKGYKFLGENLLRFMGSASITNLSNSEYTRT